jgi:hypothetical protein
MKGKVSVYFGMPNLSRLRSRLEGAPKTLTPDLRNKLAEIVAECLNESSLKVRAKFIEYINSRTDLKFKTAEHRKQAMNLFSGIFDSAFAVTSEELAKLVGEDEDDKNPEEAPAEEAGEAPAEESAGEGGAGDEFED